MTDIDLTDDKKALRGTEILDAGLDDWRWVLDKLVARFETGDFNTGTALVTKIAEAADEANHHPDVDLRYPHLTVSLKSHDVDAITPRDIRLARRISELAAEAGVSAQPTPPTSSSSRWTPRTTRRSSRSGRRSSATTRPKHDDGLRDGAGRKPTLWFQETDSDAPDRQRWHLDVSVPHDVAQARHPGGARRRRHAGQRRARPGVLGGGGRRRQPGVHLHLGVAATEPATGTVRSQNAGRRPTIRDGWHTELSAEAVRGHVVPMRFEILVRTRRVS